MSEKRDTYIDTMYSNLKTVRPDLYHEAINSAEAVTIEHNLFMNVAVSIEAATIYCMALAIGVLPKPPK